jgi:hypothetical protein
VLRFRDETFPTYYTDSRYLGMVERRCSSETVAHRREMTAHRLERHLLDGRMEVSPVRLPAETDDAGERLQFHVRV